QDWTEDGIATELLKAGVPNNEIVLGFRNPKKRPLTEFAVGYVHQGMNDGYVYIVVVSQCHIVPTM
ncbi:MAG: element excision factor XisI family protein, partial [Pseudomonadota bacterium]